MYLHVVLSTYSQSPYYGKPPDPVDLAVPSQVTEDKHSYNHMNHSFAMYQHIFNLHTTMNAQQIHIQI